MTHTNAPSNRLPASWPPPTGPLRLLIDTDAANEVDDQYAIALALGFPERLQIEGLIAAHFGDAGGGARGIQSSCEEIERVLAAAGLSGTVPILRGIDRLSDGREGETSDGIDFIIERARTASSEDPLWLLLLGPVTDAVAALRAAPDIADRMIVFWHVRSEWPERCRNFNAKNDPVATRAIFEIPCRLVLFDTGTHLEMTADESERRCGGVGSLGRYLAGVHRERFPTKVKGLFDLGDTAALVDPACAPYERTAVPGVDADLLYDFSRTHGEAVRIYDVDRERSFGLLDEALRRLAESSADPG